MSVSISPFFTPKAGPGHRLTHGFLLHVVEFVGFAARAYGHNNYTERSPFIVQTVLILVAPSLFAATVYMILGRIIRSVHAEKYSMVRVTWLTKIFVVGDVLCFFVQASGGAILAGSTENAQLGKNVILVGLVLQILLFGFFIAIAVVFHSRLRRGPTPDSNRPDIQWEKMLLVLYAVSCLIMVRNIFRVVEYVSGIDGYLYTHEWAAYVFDMALMASVMMTLLFFPPTLIRPPQGSFPLENVYTQQIDGSANRFKRESNPYQSDGPYGDYQSGVYQTTRV